MFKAPSKPTLLSLVPFPIKPTIVIMAANGQGAAAHQLIQINWVDEDGRIESVRVWGYARNVADPLNGPRVDIEVLQTALFGVQQGEATNRALRRINRKRQRKEEATKKESRRRVENLVKIAAEKAVAKAAQRREIEEMEEMERRGREEDIPNQDQEDHQGEEVEDIPQMEGAGGHDDEFEFRMVPRSQALVAAGEIFRRG